MLAHDPLACCALMCHQQLQLRDCVYECHLHQDKICYAAQSKGALVAGKYTSVQYSPQLQVCRTTGGNARAGKSASDRQFQKELSRTAGMSLVSPLNCRTNTHFSYRQLDFLLLHSMNSMSLSKPTSPLLLQRQMQGLRLRSVLLSVSVCCWYQRFQDA